MMDCYNLLNEANIFTLSYIHGARPKSSRLKIRLKYPAEKQIINVENSFNNRNLFLE